jgi:hypothetical protein
MSNHEITFTEAQQMTSAYQNDPIFDAQTVSCSIPKNDLIELFENPLVQNLKVYFAKNADNELTLVVLGADSNNYDITNKILNNFNKCPKLCIGNIFNNL